MPPRLGGYAEDAETQHRDRVWRRYRWTYARRVVRQAKAMLGRAGTPIAHTQVGLPQRARPSMTAAPGSCPSRRPGKVSLERRTPLPTTTCGAAATRASTRTGQPPGSPIGVIPPYSMPVAATVSSTGANDALRTSSSRRATPFTSARVAASTGSISATPTAPAGSVPSSAASAAATGGASRSARASAGSMSSLPIFASTGFILPLEAPAIGRWIRERVTAPGWQGGGGADSGAIGDDDNAARRDAGTREPSSPIGGASERPGPPA